jgi:hypothetical protein
VGNGRYCPNASMISLTRVFYTKEHLGGVGPDARPGSVAYSAIWMAIAGHGRSATGTNRTSGAGLTMSVPRGRPEMAGRGSNRRD